MLVAGAALASPRVPTPVLDLDEVHAGARVTVRWKALPASVEELEILLSIDGGRTYSLRVSPEIAGCEDEYVWTVPNVSATDARIRIRARIDERETEGPPSPSFTIVTDFRKPREAWLFREEGEPEPAEPAPPPSSLASRRGGPELGRGESTTAIEAPDRGAHAVRSAGPFVPAIAASCHGRDGGELSHAAPRFHPLRN